MKYTPLFLVVFALYVQASPSTRVINGQQATPGSAPYHVHLLIRLNAQSQETRVGSGCLISMTHTLTTAQNVRNFGQWQVGVGNVNREQLQWSQWTSQNVIHPQFDHNTLNNNIAIIMVQQPFQASVNIQAIALPAATDTQVPFANEEGRFNGFGFTGPTGPFANQLMMGFKRTTTDQACAQAYPHLAPFLNNNFCAVDNAQSTFCAGDQGTCIVGIVRFQTVCVGLASFTNQQCNAQVPGAFVRISTYRQWIQQHTGI
uniref:Putative serine collagenase 1 n=1 Tax=Nyssomyia neivai TaxID=330878 RepID=A0A1L8E3X4_9DIPT